jgi:transposase-like protein
VILTAVRWYLAYRLSSRQVLELLAERGVDVSHRTVLTWAQVFGPQLAAELRRRRRPVGRRWFVDEVFFFRRGHKRYPYAPSVSTARSSTSSCASGAIRRAPGPSSRKRSRGGASGRRW